MASKIFSLCFVASMAFSCCMGGLLPAVPAVVPAAYSVPYASSYSANVINHAVAAPYVAAPYLSAPVLPAPAIYPDLAPIAAYSALPTVLGK